MHCMIAIDSRGRRMINVIFKMQNMFRHYPNKLVPINDEYSLKDNQCALGDLSKTNIFIGENNSGKSRFLRSLFKNNFYTINKEGIDKLFLEFKNRLTNSYLFQSKSSISKFNFLYKEAMEGNYRYYNTQQEFFEKLEKYVAVSNQQNKYYFPTVRGVKDYKTILDTKLTDFLKSASSIQNKDSIYHYISLLNLDKKGLENYDIYREIILHEYFSNNNVATTLNIVTGGDLYRKIKSMLLGEEREKIGFRFSSFSSKDRKKISLD